ncbi:flagellar motor protein MotB [Sphingomonas sp. C3-2]|uniref:flagellar motor protein MotB n=1 Tax=Sphingomonas sp. C3-2 TaxID=3062169 RepID=UPI00294B8B2E|nr:flagellar motor protein MotB [Sphingomonas sp. C3-2]WOK37728.1 flagellar motor protein MotB [Sphingomonas sp. C3-2]
MNRNEEQPIVIRRVRRHQATVHHGGAWKVAYADFVTAMMAFFMLLWLLANQNKAQLRGLAEYFSSDTARSAPATTMTNDPGSQPGLGGRSRRAQGSDDRSIGQISAEAGTAGAARGGTAEIPEAALRVLADEMMIAIQPPNETPGARNRATVEKTREGVRVHLMDSANRSMFIGPTAQLNDYARTLLTRIAQKLVKTGAQVAIEGHTDSTGGQSDANWRLSSERALAARAAMVAAGLTADRFSEVVAKAGSEPIYPDRPDRPENRRITIVILAEPSALPKDTSFKF